MARSAAQRAARRAKRALRPVFHLTLLPWELQLNVLCKCDPITFRRLLQTSAHLRSLFLRYPETCLQQVFGHLPRNLFALLRTSWVLETVQDDDMIKLLSNDDIDGIVTEGNPLVADDEDPLYVMDGLVELYEEVEVATDLYAQSLNAAMETFINPGHEIRAIFLSMAEYCRVASTLWILRIFYQLQFRCVAQDSTAICVALINRLGIWQRVLVCGLDQWLLDIGYGAPSAIYSNLNLKYSDWRPIMNRSSYAERHFNTLRFGLPPYANRFTENIFDGNPRTFCRTAIYPPPANLTPISQPWDGSIDQTLLEFVKNNGYSNCPKWRHYIMELGLLFWDHKRLELWGLSSYDELNSIFRPAVIYDKFQKASEFP